MDEILEKLKQYLNSLEQCKIDWEKLKEDGYNINSTDEHGELWFNAVGTLRTFLKRMTLDACRKGLKSEILEYAWLDDVIKYANDTLEYYRSLAGLREIDERSSEVACNFLTLAFENYVVRVNKDFLKTCQQFEIEEKDMLKILKMLDRLADFYVSNCYSCSIIKKDFKHESDLSDAASEKFTDLVEKNYMEIKMNLIYNRLCYLQENR